MQIDKITFNDISIFHTEEEFSIFHKLNFTQTAVGTEWLRRFFSDPLSDQKKITGIHVIIKSLLEKLDEWPAEITNGTILVMDKFLDYHLDTIPEQITSINGITYRIFHSQDYSMVKYSVRHFADFYRGLWKLLTLFSDRELPAYLKFYLDRILKALKEEPLQRLASLDPNQKLSVADNLYFARSLRGRYKNDTLELIDIFGRMEAWFSMAKAVRTYDLQFPVFRDSDAPFFKAEGLRHVLLENAVAYDLVMHPGQHFVFLTGANMAGKSTLIKAVGSAVFLAHIGMGVPAKTMELTIFDGLLSNINVADNIIKGESYFYNEVQRIKTTIQKINDGKKWMVLIDELFKGTNVQDAMKCSLTVIRGLVKMKNSLFVLSTHLYEIGEELKEYPTIAFKYFETDVSEDQLHFSYQLKDGISNDRIGYVILRREKVVEMLEKL